MKKLTVILFLSCISCVVAMAQGVMKNKKISEDEVPASVLTSFKKEYPNAPVGSWTIFYKQSLDGTRLTVTPQFYSYIAKGTNGKSEAQYNPNGKLERARGFGKDKGSFDADAEKEGGQKGSN